MLHDGFLGMESKSGENFLSLQCKDKGNRHRAIAMTGRAHCQVKLASFFLKFALHESQNFGTYRRVGFEIPK